MGSFAEVVWSRRMTRAFRSDPVDPELLASLVALGARAPSAGKSQGWHLVLLEGDETALFWDITLPPARRRTFKWRHLLDAPVIALPLADPDAYVQRYSEPDKAGTGLGAGADAWPVPYWTVDASMAVMTMLLGAEDAGLGALFFGVFHGERELRRALGVPPQMVLLGAMALGWPASPGSDDAGDQRAYEPGRSSGRSGRRPDKIIHRRVW